MSRDEKDFHLKALAQSMWLAPAVGGLLTTLLLLWGLISEQPVVVLMAASVMLVALVGWVTTRDYVGHQLTSRR